jgi:hypothetical protein
MSLGNEHLRTGLCPDVVWFVTTFVDYTFWTYDDNVGQRSAIFKQKHGITITSFILSVALKVKVLLRLGIPNRSQSAYSS